jgi:hypothetical protein
VSRNIDILAVALLLAGIAVYSQARHLVVLEINSHGIGFTHYSRMVVVPPHVPAPPALPHMKVMRD